MRHLMIKKNYIAQKRQYKSKLRSDDTDITAYGVIHLIYHGLFVALICYLLLVLTDLWILSITGLSNSDLPISHQAWRSVGRWLKVYSLLGIMDVPNVFFEVTKGSMRHTAIQAIRRTTMVAVIMLSAQAKYSIAFSIMLFLWSFSDLSGHLQQMIVSPLVVGKASKIIAHTSRFYHIWVFPIEVFAELLVLFYPIFEFRDTSNTSVMLFGGVAAVHACLSAYAYYIKKQKRTRL